MKLLLRDLAHDGPDEPGQRNELTRRMGGMTHVHEPEQLSLRRESLKAKFRSGRLHQA